MVCVGIDVSKDKHDCFILSLYYRVVVFSDLSKVMCYTIRDAVDWFIPPTARRF